MCRCNLETYGCSRAQTRALKQPLNPVALTYMASTVWKGHLTFGLVSIPVRLFRAARAEKIGLHQLYRSSARRAPAVSQIDERDERMEDEEREAAPPPRIAALQVPGAPKARTAAGQAMP